MSEYIPSMEDAREIYAMPLEPGDVGYEEALAQFDRWLALIIEGAEQRGAVKAGRAILEQAIRDMDPEFGSEM